MGALQSTRQDSNLHSRLPRERTFKAAPKCSELRTSTTQTDNIRGFETKLSENEGPLKTTLAENETALGFLATFGEAGVCIGPFRKMDRLASS